MTGRKASLAVIFFTVFLDLVGFGIVIPLLPRYAESFVGDCARRGLYIGVLAASFSVMQFLFNPVWGRLSDRIGRRPVLLGSLGGFTVSYVMLGLAPGFAWLLAARILAGICGANIAAAQAYVADVTPPEKRAQGMGMIGMAFGLGFILGPAISAFLVGDDPAHPRYLLIGLSAAAMSLAAFVTAWFFLPESLPRGGPARERPRFSLAALARALSHPGLAAIFAVFLLIFIGFSIMEGVFALLLEHRFALGPRAAGYYFVLIGLIVSAMQGGLARVIVPRFGELPVVRAGIGLMALGMAGMGLARNPFELALAVATVAVGNGLNAPALLSLTSRRAGADEQGGVIGIAQGLGALGRVIGPVAGNLVFFGLGAGGLGSILGGGCNPPRHVTGAFLCAAAFMGFGWLTAMAGVRKRDDAAAASPVIAAE